MAKWLYYVLGLIYILAAIAEPLGHIMGSPLTFIDGIIIFALLFMGITYIYLGYKKRDNKYLRISRITSVITALIALILIISSFVLRPQDYLSVFSVIIIIETAALAVALISNVIGLFK